MQDRSKKAPPPTPEFVLRGSDAAVYGLCWAPGDGAQLVSGAGDGSLMLWDYASKRCRLRVRVRGGGLGECRPHRSRLPQDAHSKAVCQVAFEPDAPRSTLWSQGRDGLLKRWDVEHGTCLSGHDVGCQGFVPMSVGRVAGLTAFAAMPDPNDLRGVVALRLGEQVSVLHHWPMPEQYGMCMRVVVGGEDALVAAVFEANKMVLLSARSGACLWQGDVPAVSRVDEAAVPLTAVCFDGARGAVASGGNGVVPFAWSAEHGLQWEDAITIPRNGVSDLKVDSLFCARDRSSHTCPRFGRRTLGCWRLLAGMARYAATRGRSAPLTRGQVRVFSAKRKHKPLCVCDFHVGNVHCMEFAPASCAHSNILAAGGNDTKISLWRLY